jgi:hypothetical protein
MFQAVTRLSKAISAGVKLDEMNEVVAGVLDNTSHQLQQKNKLADKIAGVRIAITGVTSPAEISERKAIGAGMIVHTKDADHKYDETQDSVFAWVEKKFPLNPMPRNVKHLFKKITELAVEMKIDISKDEIAAALTEARKTESINAAEQVANIRGSLSQLAHSARVDEQEALNTKMRANRAALLASIREKMASKGPAANTIYRRPN